MTFPHVVWDFDGTLADTRADAVRAFNALAPRFGFRPVTDPVAARAMTTREFLRHHGLSLWRLPRVVRAFQDAVADGAEAVRLFPGIPGVLAELRSRGVRLGILSSNREGTIRRALRANGCEDHFAFVVGYPKLFGKAKALRRILRADRLDRAGVLYVGDEVRDVDAATKAGVAVAAVTWGFQAADVLRAAGPAFVLDDPRELVGVVL